MTDCYTYIDPSSGRKSQLIADDVYEIIMANKDQLDSAIIYDRDYNYDYFGFKVLSSLFIYFIFVDPACADSRTILFAQTQRPSC